MDKLVFLKEILALNLYYLTEFTTGLPPDNFDKPAIFLRLQYENAVTVSELIKFPGTMSNAGTMPEILQLITKSSIIWKQKFGEV
jgi:hypothetical protein